MLEVRVQFIYFTQIIILTEGKKGNISDNSTTNKHVHVFTCYNTTEYQIST